MIINFDRDYVANLFADKPHAIDRALVVLYHRQTPMEKTVRTTNVENGRGFNRLDARIMTSMAEQVLNGRPLSWKQRNFCITRLPKYWRQLKEEAEIKMAEKITTPSTQMPVHVMESAEHLPRW